MPQSRQLGSVRRGPARWRSVLTTTRFDAAYGLALFLALDACGTFFLGGVPEDFASERALGWTALVATIMAPVVLWLTRKTSVGPFLQEAFIIVAIVCVVATIILSLSL